MSSLKLNRIRIRDAHDSTQPHEQTSGIFASVAVWDDHVFSSQLEPESSVEMMGFAPIPWKEFSASAKLTYRQPNYKLRPNSVSVRIACFNKSHPLVP